MKFEKGNKGKPKGALNKKTIESVKRIEWVLGLLENKLQADIQKLTPRARVQLWNDLQEYIRPKLARTELTGKDGQQLIIPNAIATATIEQLKEIVKSADNTDG